MQTATDRAKGELNLGNPAVVDLAFVEMDTVTGTAAVK